MESHNRDQHFQMILRRLFYFFLSLLVIIGVHFSNPSQAQILSTKWKPLTPAEFEVHRYVFAPYGIEAHRNDLVVLHLNPVLVFRIEASDFAQAHLAKRSSC